MRNPLLFLAVAACFPLALADDPAAFEHDGVHGGGTFAYSKTQMYHVDALAGEALVATLTWTDPSAHLFLTLTSPDSPGCEVRPTTDLGCIVETPPVPECRGPAGLPTSSPYVLRATARASGRHELLVLAEFAKEPVPYHLTVQVGSGGGDRVQHVGSYFSAIAHAHVPCALLGPFP